MADHTSRFAGGWVTELLDGLASEVAAETRARVLVRCSRGCTEHWAREAAAVRASAGEASAVDALLAAFCERLPGGADLARQSGEIRWRFAGGECPCPIARLAPHPAICDCSVGHVRGMLEPLLGRPLAVELIRSRLRGAEDCLFVVRI